MAAAGGRHGPAQDRRALALRLVTAGRLPLRRGLFLPEELPALLGEAAATEALRRYDPLGDAADVLTESAAPGDEADQASSWLAVHQLETARYLRHQLLRDSDWASMAWSVELRVPLVDAVLHRHAQRVGFAPARQHGKVTAVRAAAPELPDELFGRKKTGFYVPLAEALAEDATALSHGERSRRLALQILAAHGVSLPWQEAATDAERNSRDEALSLVG